MQLPQCSVTAATMSQQKDGMHYLKIFNQVTIEPPELWHDIACCTIRQT
jgi:hypothetical protein